jgi:hypothetical protein
MFQASHLGRSGKPLKVDGIVGDETLWSLEHPAGNDQETGLPSTIVDVVQPGLAGKALSKALIELKAGVKEKPNGSNRGERIDLYTRYKGAPDGKGPPWCAYFVSWCVDEAADGHGPFGRIGNAQNIALWGKRHNASLIPGAAMLRPGDIFVIARDDVHGHTGFVRQVMPGPGASFWTVEGNAGNAVRSHFRDIKSISHIVRLPEATT